jgi:ATP-dependent RNA helicase DeaD
MTDKDESTTRGGFEAFPLDERILAALGALGFETPTPIQAATIAPLLEGRDVIGRARTGSGKTAAFGLPLIERVKETRGGVHALLLAPTRELALQVTEALRSYAKRLPLRIVTIYGGAPYEPQLRALREGAQIVVGTPGRVIDHLERGTLDLGKLEWLVLDEADEMLRMGFIEDVERVLAASPETRQVALFSATMPGPIQKVAKKHLRDPIEIQVEKSALTVEHIAQRWMFVPPRNKVDALTRVLAAETRGSTLVFARTRRGCADVADELSRRGVAVDALHGDMNQAARERVLLRFRSGKLDVVVATDVAARGIDVEHITHVINLDFPEDEEVYTHRIGRTGRAGREGRAITFVMPRERRRLQGLQRALRVDIAEMPVPSDADIERRRRERLRASIVEVAEAEPTGPLRAFTDELLEGQDAAAIARAAVQLLAERAGYRLRDDADDRPPFWARGGGGAKERTRQPRAPGEPDMANAVELFFPVGRAKGVEPKHVVAALANGLGVPASEIGRITVLPHKTFAGVTQEVADRLIAERAKIALRGNEVPVVRARPRDGGPVADKRPGPPAAGKKRRGPPPDRKKGRGPPGGGRRASVRRGK